MKFRFHYIGFEWTIYRQTGSVDIYILLFIEYTSKENRILKLMITRSYTFFIRRHIRFLLFISCITCITCHNVMLVCREIKSTETLCILDQWNKVRFLYSNFFLVFVEPYKLFDEFARSYLW